MILEKKLYELFEKYISTEEKVLNEKEKSEIEEALLKLLDKLLPNRTAISTIEDKMGVKAI